MRTRSRLLVPEVVQTSAMDCGPAALKCLLEGFGISASYGRLREACQTDVDGTSIDTMEEVARQLGLQAEQVMVPLDHLFFTGAKAFPAIIVVQLPNGLTHFVVAWRRHGRLVQVMDPATGRRWPSWQQFLSEIYVHTHAVSASQWREWAESSEFCSGLTRRLVALGLSKAAIASQIHRALSDTSWRAMATLDAATRLLDSIVRSGGLRRGPQALAVLERFVAQPESIPPNYWSAQPGEPGPDGKERLSIRGAVLVLVRGPLAEPAKTSATASLPPELAAALEEPASRPGSALLKLLQADGFLAPGIVVTALMLAAGGVMAQALLFRSVFDISRGLGLSGQRLTAVGGFVALILLLLLLEFPLTASLLRLGRKTELRLRLEFLQKIPKLGDRYFRSRLNSDMAERSHSIHRIRQLPELAGQLLRSAFELAFTTAGIIWLDPASGFLATLTAAIVVGLPLAAQPLLAERDLRLRSHTGGLSRFYLDALLGLIPVRVHGAERAVRREHESLLVEWARAGLRLQRTVVGIEAVQMLTGFGLAAWLLLDHLGRSGESGGVLLLIYWALNLPVLGQEIGLIAWQYPALRNVTLRLLEPLGARDEHATPTAIGTSEGSRVEASTASRAAAIHLEGVNVRAGGNPILEDITLHIPAKSHVAIVGASGAGKSSLVGILLGWHRASAGRVLVDGATLEGGSLQQLRRETAWVDPSVQLWNRSFMDNLTYGSDSNVSVAVGSATELAGLRSLLEKLPNGLQTALGEGGALVSGGEGQRVRLGRAILRPDVRLAILDEPFRGLERQHRQELLARCRELWKEATLFCITHDLTMTRTFDRVLVLDRGRVVEDGSPTELAERPGSRYGAMMEAERAMGQELWSNTQWRRLRLERGELVDSLAKEPRG